MWLWAQPARRGRAVRAALRRRRQSFTRLQCGETVDQILHRSPLSSRTPATITDRALLMRDLRSTRRRGYAVDRGEFQAGMTGIAVPIRMNTVPVAALTLSGPSEIFDPVRAAHAARVDGRMVEARISEAGWGLQARAGRRYVPRPNVREQAAVSRTRGGEPVTTVPRVAVASLRGDPRPIPRPCPGVRRPCIPFD